MNKQRLINQIKKRGSEYLTADELQSYLDYFNAVIDDPVDDNLAKQILLILETEKDPLREIQLLIKRTDAADDNTYQWVSATIGDTSDLSPLLDEWNAALDAVHNSVGSIRDIIAVVAKAVETQKQLLQTRSNAIKDGLEAISDEIITIIDQISDTIRELGQYGMWLLPQYEAVDIPLFFRREILGISGIDQDLIERERLIRVQDVEGDISYRRIKPKYYHQPKFETFIDDVVASFDDKLDRFRPQTNNPVAGASIVVAADDVLVFMLTILLIYLFAYGPQKTREAAGRMADMIREAVNIGEERGRLAHPDKQSIKARAIQLANRIDLFVQSELNSYAAIVKWFRDTIGLISGAPAASGDIYKLNDASIDAEIYYNNDDTIPWPANYFGRDTATIQLSISGSAIVRILIDGVEYSRYLVENSRLAVDVPIKVTKPVAWLNDGNWYTIDGQPLESIQVSAGIATLNGVPSEVNTITVELYQAQQGQTVASDLNDPVEILEWYVLRPQRLFGPAQSTLDDGFKYRQLVYAKAIANLTAIQPIVGNDTTSSLDGDSIDLTRFGDGLSLLDVTVTVDLPFIGTSALEMLLHWDGKVYKPANLKQYLDTVTAVFKGVHAPDYNTHAYITISDVRSAGDTTTTIYSNPQVIKVNRQLGKLGPPKILSGKSARVVETVTDALTRNLRRYQEVYGDTGLKQGESLNKKVTYELVVQKIPAAIAYAIIDGVPKFISTDNSPLISSSLLFDWDGQTTTYDINVYQTFNESVIEAVLTSDTEQQLLDLIGAHDSTPAEITIEIAQSAVFGASRPPDWIALNLDSVLDITSIANILSDTIKNAIKANVPRDPLGDLVTMVDLIAQKLQAILNFIDEARDIIDDMRVFLEIGSSGLWMLSIPHADNIDDFKKKLINSTPPPELANAKFVAGIQLLAAKSATFESPIGSILFSR